jgi:hypothetical protein
MVELWFCFLGEVNRHTEAAHFEAKLSPVEIHTAAPKFATLRAVSAACFAFWHSPNFR